MASATVVTAHADDNKLGRTCQAEECGQALSQGSQGHQSLCAGLEAVAGALAVASAFANAAGADEAHPFVAVIYVGPSGELCWS